MCFIDLYKKWKMNSRMYIFAQHYHDKDPFICCRQQPLLPLPGHEHPIDIDIPKYSRPSTNGLIWALDWDINLTDVS